MLKIKRQPVSTIEFSKLKIGDAFLDNEGNFCMKTNCTDDDNFIYFDIAQDKWYLCGLSGNAPCIPLPNAQIIY